MSECSIFTEKLRKQSLFMVLILMSHHVQFLVAPYSLFVSFGLAAALAPQIYMGHYISFALIEGLASSLGQFVLPTSVLSKAQAASSYLSLPIGPTFIAAFFVVDQASCLYIHFCTPSKKFTVQETLIHAVWGFLVSGPKPSLYPSAGVGCDLNN